MTIADNKPEAPHMSELLRLAQNEALSPDAARAVGADLADAYMRLGRVDDAPIAAFTSDVYLGFDARIAAIQAKAGLVRP